MIRVAVDAMGGDKAPQAEIAGVLQALGEPAGRFRGPAGRPPAVIEAELATHPEIDRSRLEIHEAADVIGMSEKPLAAVRKKPKSSVVVGLTMQKQGRSDAFLSAGNTGATLAASTVLLGLHDGVERATVATLFPTGGEPVARARRRRQPRLLRQGARRLRLPRHRVHAGHPRPRPTRWWAS